jgi:biopolymer transport protein ExbD
VMKHSVNIDLPRATSKPQDVKPQTVRLSVDAQGDYYWNESRVEDKDLARMFRVEAAREPQPELHIRADKDVRYERVAQAMAQAQQSGLRKIGFITEPGAAQ